MGGGMPSGLPPMTCRLSSEQYTTRRFAATHQTMSGTNIM